MGWKETLTRIRVNFSGAGGTRMTMLVAMLFAVVVTFLISACHHTSWDFLRGRTRLSLRVQEKIWPVHGLWWWLVH